MAHLSPALAGTSASVFLLPTAAAHPVQQHSGPGRRPKSIVNLRRYKVSKWVAEQFQAASAAKARPSWRDTEAKQLASAIAATELALANLRSQYHAVVTTPYSPSHH